MAAAGLGEPVYEQTGDFGQFTTTGIHESRVYLNNETLEVGTYLGLFSSNIGTYTSGPDTYTMCHYGIPTTFQLSSAQSLRCIHMITYSVETTSKITGTFRLYKIA